MPYCFRQEYFIMLSCVKHVTPGMGQFWSQGYSLNKLGRGPLGDATYQILRPWALCFQRRRYFHVFPISAFVKHVTSGAGLSLAPGAYFVQNW